MDSKLSIVSVALMGVFAISSIIHYQDLACMDIVEHVVKRNQV